MLRRDPLLGAVATMWQEIDPVPEDLVERLLVALALDDLDTEYALLHLVERSERLVGTRGGDDVMTLSFESDEMTMVLRVSRTGATTCRIDGWVTPGRSMTVTASQGDRRYQTTIQGGRFELTDVVCEPTRFVVDRAAGTGLATPTVDL